LSSGPHFCKGQIEATLTGIALSRVKVIEEIDGVSTWVDNEKREGLKWKYLEDFFIDETSNHLVIHSRFLGISIYVPGNDESDREAWVFMLLEQGLQNKGFKQSNNLQFLTIE
jgi:hypothetical protein